MSESILSRELELNERLRAKMLDSEGGKINAGDVRMIFWDRFGREFVSRSPDKRTVDPRSIRRIFRC